MKVVKYSLNHRTHMWDAETGTIHQHDGKKTICGREIGANTGGWFRLAEGWDRDDEVNCKQCIGVLRRRRGPHRESSIK